MRTLPKPLGAVSLLCAAAFFCSLAPARAADEKGSAKSGFVTTSDGVKIHYVETGHSRIAGAGMVGHPLPADAAKTVGDVTLERPQHFPTLLFIPGWSMPGWIWEKQVAYFSPDYRVVTMDPRSQGESSKGASQNSPSDRARDIKSVVNKLHLAPVVLIGWSMAVMDIASYVDQFGTSDVEAIVFVDGTAGSDTEEVPKGIADFMNSLKSDRDKRTADFVRSMFKTQQDPRYLDRLTQASLAMPTDAAISAMTTFWQVDNRPALSKIDRPTLIVGAQSPFVARYQEMQRRVPGSRLQIFDGVGHALFVDNADQFNFLLEDFLLDKK
jgi:non-heme chloroperoxidase